MTGRQSLISGSRVNGDVFGASAELITEYKMDRHMIIYYANPGKIFRFGTAGLNRALLPHYHSERPFEKSQVPSFYTLRSTYRMGLASIVRCRVTRLTTSVLWSLFGPC